MVNLKIDDWNEGFLPGVIVETEDLKPLTSQPSGNPIWKSNNPEQFTSDGWLMQHARSSPRGSRTFRGLKDSFGIYLFHINKTARNKFLHILATNPNSEPVTLSGKGSMLNNLEFPLPLPPARRGRGQSSQVARNWLDNNHRVSFKNVTLNPFKAYQIDRIRLRPNNMVDGRFEVTASDDVFIYSVVSSGGGLDEAVNLSQRRAASGIIASPGPGRLGREAGICRHSVWEETIALEVPDSPAYLGIELNNSKQTSDYLMRLGDSSRQSHGNYGHYYNLAITLTNSSSSSRQVRFSFASNDTSASVGSLYNGPIRLNERIINTLHTPTEPKDILQTLIVSASTTMNLSLEFYIPGLITRGQQLIFESI
ncbi:MAG: hypothetical protein QNJ64_04720 [Crocosphaera sp.]|nr:hypothetical protein [Crocosphaera sp.]